MQTISKCIITNKSIHAQTESIAQSTQVNLIRFSCTNSWSQVFIWSYLNCDCIFLWLNRFGFHETLECQLPFQLHI